MIHRLVRAAGAACLVLACGGCALYSASFATVQNEIAAQRYDAALGTLERLGTSSTDEVLFLLNKAMLQRMDGQLAHSNDTFEQAKRRSDELSAVSLTENTLSFIVNDSTKSYVGEEHEQVLLHVYQALNYLELGRLDEARVEVLQLDEKLKSFSDRIEKNIYVEDPLARYVMGLVFEENREWSDALIAYRKAYDAFRRIENVFAVRVPEALKHDLLRLTAHVGLKQEHEKYKKEFGISTTDTVDERAARGELVFVLHNGWAPVKRERALNLPDLKSGLWVRVSLPYYETRPPQVTAARVTLFADALPADTLPALAQVETELFENVDAVARKSLEAKMPVISARAVARAATKRAASLAAMRSTRGSGNNSEALAGLFLGLGLEVFALLSERADTRSWLTLPHDIQLARVTLPPGKARVKVDLLKSSRETTPARDTHVVIEPGRKRYLSYHYVDPQSY
jgi:hypothetical protein